MTEEKKEKFVSGKILSSSSSAKNNFYFLVWALCMGELAFHIIYLFFAMAE